MSLGLVTGVLDGRVVGWLSPEYAGEAVELVLEDGVLAGSALANLGSDGQARFAIPLSSQLPAGKMLFVEVRLARDGTPLPGSPVLWDGGLLGARDGAVAADLPVFDLGRDLPLPTPHQPVEIDGAGYLEGAARARLSRLPIEAREPGPPAEQLTRRINQLRAERRRLMEAPGPFAAVLVLLADTDDAADVWSLQSHPGARPARRCADGAALAELARSADLVFFAGAGDMIHPAAASAAQAYEADVVTWDRFVADAPRAESPGWTLRRPAFDPITVRQGAVTDTSFAVSGAVLAQAPGPVLDAAAVGRLHPLLFWLAGRNVKWARHPEALTASLDAPAADRAALAQDRELCAELLLAAGAEATLVDAPDTAAAPFLLLPDRRAGTISFVLELDQRRIAAERTLRALLGQRLSGEAQLLLIDRGAQDFDSLAAFSRRVLGEDQVRVAGSAADATGEVLVFLEPGVHFDDPLTIEQMAMWALDPAVGAVGCTLRQPGGVVRHGLRANAADPFTAPLTADEDSGFAGHVRATAGVSLSLAAIGRATFEAAGGFDPRFGDLAGQALMLACSAKGLVHLQLGHLSAQIGPPAVRPQQSVASQARLLRALYAAELAGLGGAAVRERIGGDQPVAVDGLAELRQLALSQRTALARAEAARAETINLLNLANSSRDRRLPLGD